MQPVPAGSGPARPRPSDGETRPNAPRRRTGIAPFPPSAVTRGPAERTTESIGARHRPRLRLGRLRRVHADPRLRAGPGPPPGLASARRVRPARRARRRKHLLSPQVSGGSRQGSHVLDDGLDLRVTEDEAEGRHPRLAEGRPAVADQLDKILVRQRRQGRAGEVAGPQEEQTRPPRVSTSRGAVAARAVRLEERAAGLRPAGRRRQRRANQGHTGGQKRQQRDPGDSPGEARTRPSSRRLPAEVEQRPPHVRTVQQLRPGPVTRIRPTSST